MIRRLAERWRPARRAVDLLDTLNPWVRLDEAGQVDRELMEIRRRLDELTVELGTRPPTRRWR